MIERTGLLERVQTALGRSPVVMLVGPRQVGKTTLAREVVGVGQALFFDLEVPSVAALLAEPMTALEGAKGLVVLDEAQREPALFAVLRVLADRPSLPARFLVLGSASPDLSRQASESLAGRVEVIDVGGFTLDEVGTSRVEQLWLRGGFPRSFLAADDDASDVWRGNFVQTFLERDLGVLGFGINPKVMGRFWTMLSHYHGQIWNASEMGASLGISPNTARSYLDALEQTFMVRLLQPWYENVGKRLVKSPKVYLRDSGIFHSLQHVSTSAELLTHPKLGASWEGFALEHVLQLYKPRDAWFYAVHSGSELDLFFQHRGRRIGVEFKRQDAPRLTRSMQVAAADLKLDQLMVVYPGAHSYALSPVVQCVPFASVGEFV